MIENRGDNNVNGPMDGVKVVELAVWIAGPAAAGILADKLGALADPRSRLLRKRRWAIEKVGIARFSFMSDEPIGVFSAFENRIENIC